MYFEALAQKYHFSLSVPVKELSKEALDVILYGTKGEKIRMTYNGQRHGCAGAALRGHPEQHQPPLPGNQSDAARKELEECMSTAPCPVCKGKRLSDIALAVTVGGIGIMDFCAMSVRDELEFMENLKLEGNMAIVAQQIIREIKSRLRFLMDVGLQYLTLSRSE